MYFDFAGPRRGAAFFFGGRFSDTNRLWLNQINQPLHFVLAQVLFGSFANSFFGSLLHRIASSISARFVHLQVEVDEMYKGRDFDHQFKYASHLAYVTTVLIYSSAIPDLLLSLPLYFILHYWLDKWEILRVCKVPPRYAVSLNDRASNILGFAIGVHLAVNLWVFSVPEIFP